MENKDFKLDLSIEEMKIIISALAELPFKTVFELIGKINENANLNVLSKTVPLYVMAFKDVEIRLIISSLGQLPFEKVYGLMGKINEQLES